MAAPSKFQLIEQRQEAKVVKLGQVRGLAALLTRLRLAGLAGQQFGTKRKLYDVFGYNKSLKDLDFVAKYQRQDITSRIIDAPPGATWSNPPKMVKAKQSLIDEWEKVVRENKLWSVMQRADRLARLSPFSIIFFGFNDTGNVEREAQSNVGELLYLRAYSSRLVNEIKLVDDTKEPRFGLPETYKIEFDDPKEKSLTSQRIDIGKTKSVIIHASRVIHVIESQLEDPIFGVPIIEKCYNLLDDLIKVAGGTAETYWLTANRGMQADIDKDMDIDPKDAEALSDEFEDYQHELRRIIRTRGVDIKVLDSKTPSPKEVFEMIMALISGTTGIPRRILLGSEAGQLASEQDRANWAERIGERRMLFAEPVILDPVVGLLQSVGILPEGEWEWEWPSAFILSPLESSMVEAQKARAIGNISRQTGSSTPMQLTSREEAREIIGLEGDLSESDLLTPLPEDSDPFEDEEDDGDRRRREGDDP